MNKTLKEIFEQYQNYNDKGQLVPLMESELGKELFGEVNELNKSVVIHSADDDVKITYGERDEDGFVKVYRNGEHTCNMFVFTAEQADKIEQINRELQEELRLKQEM